MDLLCCIPALALTLAPCFWQPRIMAGDLSSHVYNAWLAELIGQGRAPGMVLVDQHTNVLFDWILAWLLPRTGASASQKMAVALAVMIFVSGALALIERFSGQRYLHPLFTVSILAYGYAFGMGFMNFHLSLGLCFWAIALAWRGNARRVVVSAVLLAAGWVAHLLPVLWAVGVMVYVWAWRRLPTKRRPVFFGAALITLGLFHSALAPSFLRAGTETGDADDRSGPGVDLRNSCAWFGRRAPPVSQGARPFRFAPCPLPSS